MRVLIISHNVFSSTQSMGKTLSAYFHGFSTGELAQFYIHNQIPTSNICQSYYRVTDKDAIKSIIGFRVGKSFSKNDIDECRIDARGDTGITAAIYQKARLRTPFTYIIRNLWWRLSHWNNKRLRKWLDSFKPECVFFASGDYAFMYDVARTIAQERNIPLYVSCMDDYYFYNRNSDSYFGRLQHRHFMRSVNKTMDYAKALFCICEKMSTDYSAFFGKKCITIYTPASISMPLQIEKKKKISYLGNLSYQRFKQLITIGRALKSLNLVPNRIDVYSSETRSQIVDEMNEGNGIVFHGAVGSDEVINVIGESMAVIHTESFEDPYRSIVKYSVSTKIADSLASGTCIFAFGPSDIASLSYLMNKKAAICCTNPDSLSDSIRGLLVNDALREATVKNALRLANENHRIDNASKVIRLELAK